MLTSHRGIKFKSTKKNKIQKKNRQAEAAWRKRDSPMRRSSVMVLGELRHMQQAAGAATLGKRRSKLNFSQQKIKLSPGKRRPANLSVKIEN